MSAGMGRLCRTPLGWAQPVGLQVVGHGAIGGSRLGVWLLLAVQD